jgi:hypothetical protein
MIISNLESDEREGHGKGADESRLGISWFQSYKIDLWGFSILLCPYFVNI